MKLKKNKRFKLFLSQQIMKTSMLFFGILLVKLLSAQNIVYVGGTLTNNRIWNSDSIYVVYQDLRIPEGVKLIIPQGTTIKVVQSRGIYVEGIMRVGSFEPNIHDSVYFMSNSQKNSNLWRWKGIVYKNSIAQDSNFIVNANIKDVETAIELSECENVKIKNCKLYESQQEAVKIEDSKNCLITNCNIFHNYLGITMYSTTLHKTLGNKIINNFFDNENHNLYIYSEIGSVMKNNLIKENIIQNGNNGIWIDNAGEHGIEYNIILKNIFISNGGNVGYALFTATDSTYIINNIFWKNNIAIYCEQNVNDCVISNNSLYKNNIGIDINRNAKKIEITNNTFSSQKIAVDFSETLNNTFSHNNIFSHTYNNIVVNETNENFNITDNFWNTLSDSIIDNLIWDKKDNPVLGTLYYNPILVNADTTNPVSPPYLVKKQWINGKTLVSWSKNKEKDVVGYKIYWGDFERYAFSDSLITGLDTSIYTQTALNQAVAVTAYDTSGKLLNKQLSGHESPYSFSVVYPYAGKDKVICKYQNAFVITDSNIPFAYKKIKWLTSGDGSFNNDSIINPIYYPSYNDIQTGKVILTLHVQNNNNQWLDDISKLTIMDNPLAYAGNDTTIFNTDSLSLDDATALNFNQLLWKTGGDGFFNNDTIINPIYFAGEHDKQQRFVTLYFYVYSQCGFSSDSLKLYITPAWQLNGKIWFDDLTFKNAVIMAQRKNDTSSKSITMANVQPDGIFHFDKLKEGNYFLYAVPDTNIISTALPTYYVNTLRWQNSYLMPIFANTYDVDIHIRNSVVNFPDGVGTISGHFAFSGSSLNFNSYFQSWFSENNNVIPISNGMPNATILLYDVKMKNVFRFALTDKNGNFVFKNLPFGNYRVDVEMADYNSNPSSIITLTPDNNNISNIILEINQKKIFAKFIPNKNSSQLDVYPNPVSNILNVSSKHIKSPIAIFKLFNLQGRCVLSKPIIKKNSSDYFAISGFQQLPSGAYSGLIFANNKLFTFRVIKQ